MAEWTDKRIEQLKALYGEELSNAQIARRLGGVSRCAVIGKISRLGLNNAHKKLPNPRQRLSSNFTPLFKPTSVKVREIAEPEPASLCVPLTQISDGQCKWIAGDSGMHATMCGHDALPLQPYCAYHFARCHVPMQPRRFPEHRGREK